MLKNAALQVTALRRRSWDVRGAYRARLRGMVLLCLLVALSLPTVAGAAKHYQAEHYDVDLVVQEDGSLVVTETIVFHFEGGPFTYVFRDLAYNEIDAIDRLQASMDGHEMSQGTGPGHAEIEAGDPLKVTWHFAPTSDSTHTFTLVYRVQGALRQLGDADPLIWRAIPEEHDYDIGSSTITLSFPSSASLQGQPVVRGVDAAIDSGANRVVITTQAIEHDQDVVVEARFAPGSLISTPPDWQVARAERAGKVGQALPQGVAAAVLSIIAGGGLLVWFWRRHPRPRPSVSAVALHRTAPPSSAPPAIGVKLANGALPALATMFDLARRGVLGIEEAPGRWRRKFIIYRLPSDEALLPHELGLLDALLRSRTGTEDNLDVSSAGRRLASHRKSFSQPLDEEMLAAGLLDPQRRQQRQRLQVLTLVALPLGMAAFVGAVVLGGSAASHRTWDMLPITAILAGVGAGVFIVGFVGMILASSWSTLTAAGEESAAAWRSFLEYVKDVAKGRQTLMSSDLFEVYLPFAAGYGLAEDWARRFEQQTGIAIPAWFGALRVDDSAAAFVAVMAATHSSFSSSGAGGAAGAAGASGGGASGAG